MRADGRAAGDLPDRQKRFGRQSVVRLERSRPAVRHQELATLAAADGDAFGIGGGEEHAGVSMERPLSPALSRKRERGRIPSPACGRRWRGAPDEGLARPSRKAFRQTLRLFGALRPVAAERLEPAREIDRVAAESALGQHDRDFARRPRFARARGVDDHARQPRRQREARDGAAFVGDAALAVDGADGDEQRARFGDAPRGGASRKASVVGSATPQAAQSSRNPERSAERISGAA